MGICRRALLRGMKQSYDFAGRVLSEPLIRVIFLITLMHGALLSEPVFV